VWWVPELFSPPAFSFRARAGDPDVNALPGFCHGARDTKNRREVPPLRSVMAVAHSEITEIMATAKSTEPTRRLALPGTTGGDELSPYEFNGDGERQGLRRDARQGEDGGLKASATKSQTITRGSLHSGYPADFAMESCDWRSTGRDEPQLSFDRRYNFNGGRKRQRLRRDPSASVGMTDLRTRSVSWSWCFQTRARGRRRCRRRRRQRPLE
jgi:hypothetical protein